LQKKIVRFVFTFVVLCAVPSWASWGLTQVTSATGSHVTSVSKAYGSNLGSGHLLIALVGTYCRSCTALPTVSSTNNGTWSRGCAVGGFALNNESSQIFFVPSSTSGADTVTVTDSGSTNDFDLIITEYSGNTGTFTFDSCSPGANGVGSPAGTGSLYTGNSSGDLLIASVYNENSGSLTYTCGTGYTNQQTTSNPDGASSALCDNQTGASANTSYSTSTTVSGGGSGNATVLASFRSILPTIGRLQYTQLTTSSASQAFPLPNAAGDLLIALLKYPSIGSTPAPPTDTLSNSWIILPISLECDGCSAENYYLAYARNCAAGGNTVTEAGSGGDGIELWEYGGVATVTPLAGSSMFFQGSASVSSINPGTVVLPSSGVLFSVARDSINAGNTLTGASGYIPVTYSSAQSLQQWDQVATAGSYDNAITLGTASTTTATFLVAFSATNLSTPVVRSENALGVTGDASVSTTLANPAVAGDLVIVITGSASGGSTGTLSDNFGSSYTLIQGGGTNLYGLWYTVLGSSGTLTVTNTSVNSIGVFEIERVSSPTLDQSNGASTTGTSLGTGSITTTANNEILFSVGQMASITNRWLSSSNTGWSNMQFATAGHNGSVAAALQFGVSIGTYSNTFNWVTSAPIGAAIASFKLSSGSHPNMPPAVY
jgi:hypothetical protein